MTLKEMIIKNRSTRGFDRSRRVTDEELREMLDCARLSAASMNMQPIKFYATNDEEEVLKINDNVIFGGSLRELNLPYEGTEPVAYIALCQDLRISEGTDRFLKDIGIQAQSITLAAVEMGLNALMIGAYNPETLREVIGLPHYYEILLVIAVGKSAETIEMVEFESLKAPESEGCPAENGEAREELAEYRKADLKMTRYYRKDGVHYVPKRTLDEVIITK